ncbi:MAG: RNA polymerase III subunit C82 [Bathelium mastoideum]|nr:MAG: RNA polymerase III subunit C82 [Bathelium mastoideum]
MAQNLVEICTLLVDDLYGELSSQVFAILMRLGRASFPMLRVETRLSTRNLRNALAVLIQQQLCLWYTDDDGVSHYEADWYHAYALVKSGKIVRVTEERCGEAAGLLMSNLLELGHCRVGDLVVAYAGVIEKNPSTISTQEHHINSSTLTNGFSDREHNENVHEKGQRSGQIESVAQLRAELDKLLKLGLVRSTQSFHFKPDADIHTEASVAVRDKGEFSQGIKGTKATARYEHAVGRQKKQWRDDSMQIQPFQSTSTNSKRKREENDATNERIKPNGYLTNGINGINGHAHSSDYDGTNHTAPLDDNVVVRVNYEKFNVLFRSEQLVGLSERFLGEITAKVFETAVRLVEKKIPRCFDQLLEALKATPVDEEGDECDDDEYIEPLITPAEIAAALDPNIDLKSGLGHGEGTDDNEDDRRQRQTTVNEDLHDGDDVNNLRANGTRVKEEPESEQQQLIHQYMEILREDPRHFVNWEGSRRGGEWSVNFRSLTKYLIQIQIDNTVTARFGREAARVIRVLHSKGKLDEKQVAKFGFLREKHVRAILTRLQEAGFVEVQEVPKDNNRQPSRTIFLWYFDQDRCRRLILHDTYQAMARILQRAKFEKDRIKDVLDKAERTDVKGKEDRFLTEDERLALRRWLEVEEILLTQLGRQDDLVALLRDFIHVEAV